MNEIKNKKQKKIKKKKKEKKYYKIYFVIWNKKSLYTFSINFKNCIIENKFPFIPLNKFRYKSVCERYKRKFETLNFLLILIIITLIIKS